MGADFDWKRKGRGLAQRATAGRADRARAALAEASTAHEPYLRSCLSDLLGAVRWTAEQIAAPLPSGGVQAEMEADAVRLLMEGFRERLTEIAEGVSNGR